MGQYSIKELEKLSGIKAHTIRIWEKRHELIAPSRTATNIRYYSDDDLKRIMNVSILINSGLRISKIINLSKDELKRLVHERNNINSTSAPIDRLIVAMIDLDERKFLKVLNEISKRQGFENLIIKTIYPFLEKIGILWQTGNISPVQEHFISNLIRQKLIVAIDGIPIPTPKSKSAILFLPENEYHELGLLFSNYVVRKNGIRTYYLGQSVPYSDLLQIVKTHQPDFIITSLITTLNKPKLESYLKGLSKDFKKQQILISGQLIKNVKLKLLPNVKSFASIEEFRILLNL